MVGCVGRVMHDTYMYTVGERLDVVCIRRFMFIRMRMKMLMNDNKTSVCMRIAYMTWNNLVSFGLLDR